MTVALIVSIKENKEKQHSLHRIVGWYVTIIIINNNNRTN